MNNFDGKIPPQAIEIEEVVLGAALLQKDATITALQLLKPDNFYLGAHQIIFRAISDLFTEGKGVDLLTVTQKLKQMDSLETVGGAYYIAQLTRRVATGARQEEYCYILLQQWMRRVLIDQSSKAAQNAFDDTEDIHSLIDSFVVNLLKMKEGLLMERTIDVVSNENMQKIKAIKTGEIKRYGISTQLTDLDNIINGLIAPDLIVVAGRPGMGKTAFVLTILKNVAIKQNIPVGMISLEMGTDQLEIRLKSMISGVSGSRALRGNINDQEVQMLEKATTIIEKAPIHINDKSGIKVVDLRAKAIEWKATYNIGLLILDYIQLINDKQKGDSRDRELSFVSGSLKGIAKELNIPVIALSQLNREVERRNPPEPRLADLRESGSIEQDADIVMMLYRPEYYDINEVDVKGEMVSSKDVCIVNIEKHRNGAVGTFAVSVDLPTSHFTDYKSNYEPDLWIDNGDLAF